MTEKTLDLIAKKIFLFMRGHVVFSLLSVFVLANLLLLWLPFENPAFVFNQQVIEGVNRQFGRNTSAETISVLKSNYSARLNNLLNGFRKSTVDLGDINTVFDYVWSNIPYYSIVYPTEMYFYYKIPDAKLAGNLRFSDIQHGNLSFAFFNTENVENFDSSKQYKVFTAKDGLEVGPIVNDRVKLTYKGKSVTFELPHIQYELPKSMTLLPVEEIVAKIRDESGIVFYLIFNKKTNSFYDVLDEERPVTENLTAADENIFLGDRTQFAYYQDKKLNRKVLFGVNVQNIMDNNYFDGPFDQVPPNLALRERLYKAYPYTQYLNGLDEHGNFLDFNGTRVAISPYVDYYAPDITDLQKRVRDCQVNQESSAFLICLTYEDKKDFHKEIPQFFYPDGTKKTKAEQAAYVAAHPNEPTVLSGKNKI